MYFNRGESSFELQEKSPTAKQPRSAGLFWFPESFSARARLLDEQVI